MSVDLLGREAELATLHDAIRAAQERGSVLLMICVAVPPPPFVAVIERSPGAAAPALHE